MKQIIEKIKEHVKKAEDDGIIVKGKFEEELAKTTARSVGGGKFLIETDVKKQQKPKGDYRED